MEWNTGLKWVSSRLLTSCMNSSLSSMNSPKIWMSYLLLCFWYSLKPVSSQVGDKAKSNALHSVSTYFTSIFSQNIIIESSQTWFKTFNSRLQDPNGVWKKVCLTLQNIPSIRKNDRDTKSFEFKTVHYLFFYWRETLVKPHANILYHATFHITKRVAREHKKKTLYTCSFYPTKVPPKSAHCISNWQ